MDDKQRQELENLYERWKKAMGGDNPSYDNDWDAFLVWLEFEIEECELEND